MALTGEFPLMYREAEIERIVAGLQGRAPVAFVVAGPAGVGKTRIATEVHRYAATKGFDLVQVAGTRASAAIPFGPFAPLLPASGAADRLGLMRQAIDAIAGRASRDRKVLMIVDDAQYLDDGSATLVHQFAHTRSCALLATVRTPGPAPDPVTALWKDGLAERIDLRAWNEEETGAVLAAALGGPVAKASIRRLWQLSQGNALYLRELIRGAIEGGTLRQADKIWSLTGPLSPPDRLVELVASRLQGLPADTIAVIEVLAVGEPLAVSMIGGIVSADGLEDAEVRGLVQVQRTAAGGPVSASGRAGAGTHSERRTEARLAHPIYGEALRQSLPRTRLRRISAMLADAIAATGARRREDLLRLATWRLGADSPADPAMLTRAARRAQEMFDMELAARLARTALDLGGGVEAGLALGEALFRSGEHRAAESVLAEMVPLCKTDRDISRIANARAHNFHNLLGDSASATAVLDEALAKVKDDAARLQLLGRLATMRVFEENPEGALAAAAPLLASDDDAIVSRGSYASSIALALTGRSAQALAVAENGLASHRRAAGVMAQLPEVQLIGIIFAHLAAGDLAQAAREAARGDQASLAVSDMEGHATWLLLQGLVSIEQGHLARAATEFRDGASVNRDLHDLAALRWCLAGVALAEAMSGGEESARAAAAEAAELPVGPMTVYETDLIARSQAWVSAVSGDLSLACEILVAAAGRAELHGLRIAEARLLHDLARLGRPRDVAARLAELAGDVNGRLVTAQAAHAAALVEGKAKGLEAAADALAEVGAALLAAEAYAAAAAAYRSEGYPRAASAAARMADELATACGSPRTPGLVGEDQVRQLTRREREIASLAAAGVPSRQIAARLVLSVRTVDNHLQSAYLKLGVSSREDLARMLGLSARPD